MKTERIPFANLLIARITAREALALASTSGALEFAKRLECARFIAAFDARLCITVPCSYALCPSESAAEADACLCRARHGRQALQTLARPPKPMCRLPRACGRANVASTLRSVFRVCPIPSGLAQMYGYIPANGRSSQPKIQPHENSP